MSLEIEEIDVIHEQTFTPATTTTTTSEISNQSSSLNEMSEIETLKAAVKKNQEEISGYVEKFEKFQNLLETILEQVGKLSAENIHLQNQGNRTQDRRHREHE